MDVMSDYESILREVSFKAMNNQIELENENNFKYIITLILSFNLSSCSSSKKIIVKKILTKKSETVKITNSFII